MPCFLVLAASFLFAFAASAQEPTEPEPESSGPSSYGVLYEAEGVAETFAFCTGCHSEHIVAQQGLKREDWDDLFTYMVDEHGTHPEPFRTKSEDWDDLFTYMVDEHGMASLASAPARQAWHLLDYLSAHYGPDRPHFPK